jgi:hypothetical protein
MATVPGTPQSDTAVIADPGDLRGPDIVLPESILPKEEQEPPKGEQETLVIDIPAPDRAAQYDDGIDLTDDQDAPLPINIPPVEIERPVDDDISDQFIADYERTMMLDTANEAGLQDGALKDMLSPDKEPVNVQETLDLQGPGEIIGPGPTEEEIQAFTEAAKDLPLSVVGGVFDAIEATVALAQEVVIFLPAHIMGIEVSEEFKKKASDILPDIPQSDSTVNQIVRTLVQFGTGFGVVNVARLAAGVALPAGRVPRLTVQELQFALGEGLAFPENQARFSNILKQMGFDNALIDALRAPEKGEQAESVILGRVKAALEGFLIGLPFVFIEALAPFIIGVFKSHRAVDEARDRIVDYADQMVETGGEGRRVLQENELLFQQDVETLSRTLNIDKDQAERMMTRAEEMGISLDDVIRNEGGSIRVFADRGGAPRTRDLPPEQQAEAGLKLNPEVTQENIRLKRGREGKEGIGGPNLPRTVIKAPAGSGLPDFVVGDITFDDWIARSEALQNPAQIMEAARWYDDLFSVFLREAGGDEKLARTTMRGWLVAQQNIGVTGALNNVLLQAEQFARSVKNKDLKMGGLKTATDAIRSVLKGKDIESGVASKISDFVDSADDKSVRSWMDNQPDGGEPFVVDVHTARDLGFVDPSLMNHLRRLGYDVPDMPEGVAFDQAGGGVKETKYENRAEFGLALTDHLNSIKWMGRSDWKPKEIQAVGWAGMMRLTGDRAMSAQQAFQQNRRRIAFRVDPGAGSPFAAKFGDRFQALPFEEQTRVTQVVTIRAMEIAEEVSGINLQGIVHATGGWEMFQNPAAVAQTLATREGAERAANVLGLLLQQTDVMINRVKDLTKNPKAAAIDFIEEGTVAFRENDALLAFWDRLVEADSSGLIKGYQPITTVDGKVGIRVIVERPKGMGAAKFTTLIDETISGRIRDMLEAGDETIRVRRYEAEVTHATNDWRKDRNGQAYRRRLAELGVGRTKSNLTDNRRELEELIDAEITRAEGGPPPDRGGGGITVAARGEEVVEGAEGVEVPPGLEGLSDAAILPGRHSPLVTRFIEENKRHLGIPSAGDDPTDIVTNIQRRLQSELEAFGRSAEDKSLAPGDLPSNIETVPLVTIADDPLTVPEISGLARVLADKLGIAPPGTMSIDDLGETAMEEGAYRGGNALTLTLNPTITDDGFVTVMPHEVGHVVSFRIEEMRRAMLTDGGENIDDMIERGVQLGTITRDEIEVIQGNRLFDGIVQTLRNINEGMSHKKAESLAMDIASELQQITHSRRHWSWEQAETSDNMLAYMSHPSEILADGIADFMQYPLSVKDVMPNWTAFLKKLVNEDKLISKVIAIASLSGIMLPGLPELAKEVDQSVLGDIDG